MEKYSIKVFVREIDSAIAGMEWFDSEKRESLQSLRFAVVNAWNLLRKANPANLREALAFLYRAKKDGKKLETRMTSFVGFCAGLCDAPKREAREQEAALQDLFDAVAVLDPAFANLLKSYAKEESYNEAARHISKIMFGKSETPDGKTPNYGDMIEYLRDTDLGKAVVAKFAACLQFNRAALEVANAEIADPANIVDAYFAVQKRLEDRREAALDAYRAIRRELAAGRDIRELGFFLQFIAEWNEKAAQGIFDRYAYKTGKVEKVAATPNPREIAPYLEWVRPGWKAACNGSNGGTKQKAS